MSYRIQEIFQCVKGSSPLQSYSLNKAKTFNAISSCRTPAMGGFIRRCDDCSHTEAHFHSCRNRHCPICQGSLQQQWVNRQTANTLPLPYFHVVFTLPSELNTLMLANPDKLYNLLFQAASRTILTLAADEKFLGAQAGFTAVLHTWGSNLQFHPHLHCIVAGGGLSIGDNRFVRSKESFFLPVKVMSKVFRGKFLEQLKLLFKRGMRLLPEELDSDPKRQAFLDMLYSTDWVVYCKKPFSDPSNVIRYLSRYTHRVAISESRIICHDPIGMKVLFKWKDYRDTCSIKIMELSDEEFVRRFLLHTLPDGFMKIRYFGFIANNGRDKRLDLCLKLLNTSRRPVVTSGIKPAPGSICCCPICGSINYVLVFSSNRCQPALRFTGTGP